MKELLSLLLFAVLLSAAHATPHEPAVRVGVSLSLTGRYAEMGRANRDAYRLWETDVNGRGGLLGRRVQVVVHDDRSEPELAHALYTQMIQDDKVDLVLGPYSSDITKAVSQVTEAHGYPLLASGAAADTLWQRGHRYLFGVYITANKYAVGFLELLARNRIDRIAMIHADDEFSRSVANGVREWSKRFGLSIVACDEFRKDAPDLVEPVRRAHASGANVLMVLGHFDESVRARAAAKTLAWQPQAFYATVGPTTQKYHDMLRADAEGVFSSSQWEPSSLFPGARQFAEAYRSRFGTQPGYHAASPYAAGQILEAAVRKAGSLDRDKVRDALSSLDTITIMGRYGVDRTGKQIRHFASTVQWQAGHKEIVFPEDFAKGKPAWTK